MKLAELDKQLAEYRRHWESGNLNAGDLAKLEQQIDEAETLWTKLKKRAGDTPKISVVMSVYNTERFVGIALQSILDQTFSDFEVILIDDGSSDRSIEIVKSFNDPRVRLVHQTNHGLVYSFNKGLALARAEFVARMDADDIALPSRFEKEFIWLSASPKRGLVGTFFSYIDEDSAKPLDVVMTSPTKHIDIVRMMHIVNPYGHGSILMRKSAADGVGGYRSEYEPSEDYDLWRRIAKIWEVGQIPEVLYLWRFHPGSISRRKSKVSNSSAAKTVENTWRGRRELKSPASIVRDARYYQSLNSPLADTIYNQYISHQERLAPDFFKHHKILTGYCTAIGLLWLRPRQWRKLLKLIVVGPFK